MPKQKNSGILITFEGTEGVGKSTLIREIAQQLEKRNYSVVLTREPGGSTLAEEIRKVILRHTMDPWTELFLYEASRAEHLVQTILPALEVGKVVLCDRFADSSLAYQGHARGLPWKEVQKLNHVATRGLKPNLTVLLDLDPKVGLDRATIKTRFENEGLKFQQKVRQGFLKAMKQEPRRWIKLQARGFSPEELAAQFLKHFDQRFAQKKTRKRKP